MDEKELSEKTIIRSYKLELLRILPLEREVFLARLEKANLLPEGSGTTIRAKNERDARVSYLLQNVVEPAADVYLPILIDVMEKSDDVAVNRLASKMRESLGTYLLTKHDSICMFNNILHINIMHVCVFACACMCDVLC